MARTTLVHDKLGWPFFRIREALFVLDAAGTRVLNNRKLKVLYVLDGSCRVVVDGLLTEVLEPGDIFINPHIGNQRYESLTSRSHERIYTYGIYIEPAALQRKRLASHESSLRSVLETIMMQPLVLKRAIDLETRQLLTEVRSELELLYPGRDAQLYAGNVSLLVRLVRQMHPETVPEPQVRRPADIIISGVKEFINKSQRTKVSLGDIAWHVNLSPEHLSRVFRRELGMSVMTYVRYCRVEDAKTQLLGHSEKISVLARKLGFGNVHNFIRNFKEQVGCTPTEYRQRYAGRKN